MSSHEHIHGLLHIIYSDGSFRNQMMRIRLRNANIAAKLPLPETLDRSRLTPTNIQKISEILTGRAFIESSVSRHKFGTTIVYSWMYFENEEDAVALKLLYEGDD